MNQRCTRFGAASDRIKPYANEGSGIQWPSNEAFPHGAERLFTEGVFNTSADYCQDYGHDLITGGARTAEEYRAHDPQGKALRKPADYQPPHEEPDDEYSLWLTTGRVVDHWHTRTNTANLKELNVAAPEAFVQLSDDDAAQYSIAPGDMVEVESRRGRLAVGKAGDIMGLVGPSRPAAVLLTPLLEHCHSVRSTPSQSASGRDQDGGASAWGQHTRMEARH